jgi:dTDP-glucose 4,6-dehydratase
MTVKSERYCSRYHVLLTGGTGFFGRALLRHWSNKASNGEEVFRVCILSRRPQQFLKNFPEFDGQPWLHFHKGDILDPNSLPDNKTFSHILHAATDSTLGPQLNPLQRYSQIVDGTRNILNYAVEKRISRFLLTSSGGVYGPQPQNLNAISEDYHGMPDPLRPENAYSVAKRCAEHLCSLYREQFGLQTVIARCFAFVGRDLPLDVHFAIGNFIRDALFGSEILVKGDGSPVRTFLDQRDLAHWLTTIMFSGNDGEAYNVGSDSPISIQELANLVRDTLAPNKVVRIVEKSISSNLRNRYVPSIIKARTQLQLDVSISLQQSILDTVVQGSRHLKGPH